MESGGVMLTSLSSGVGDRLQRLGQYAQVLVVTRAPQVAARANQHLRVEKAAARGRAAVSVDVLTSEERREEIARMLVAADSLIKRSA